MSHSHEYEIEQDAKRQILQEKVDGLLAMTCPFCGEKEIYVYPPSPPDPELPQWLTRRWWTVGCQSRTCDSSWRIEKDHYHQVESMLSQAQPNYRIRTGEVMPKAVALLAEYGARFEYPGYIDIDHCGNNYAFGDLNGSYAGDFSPLTDPGDRRGVEIEALPRTATAEELAAWVRRALAINPNRTDP